MELVWGDHLNRKNAGSRFNATRDVDDNQQPVTGTPGQESPVIVGPPKCSAVLQQLSSKLRSKLVDEDVYLKLTDKVKLKELRRGDWLKEEESRLDLMAQSRPTTSGITGLDSVQTAGSNAFAVDNLPSDDSNVVTQHSRGAVTPRRNYTRRSSVSLADNNPVPNVQDQAPMDVEKQKDKETKAPSASQTQTQTNRRPKRSKKNLNENFVRINKKCKGHVRYRPHGQLGKGGYSKWKRKRFWKLRRQARYDEFAKARADAEAEAKAKLQAEGGVDANVPDNRDVNENATESGLLPLNSDVLEDQTNKTVDQGVGNKRTVGRNRSTRKRTKLADTSTTPQQRSKRVRPANSPAADHTEVQENSTADAVQVEVNSCAGADQPETVTAPVSRKRSMRKSTKIDETASNEAAVATNTVTRATRASTRRSMNVEKAQEHPDESSTVISDQPTIRTRRSIARVARSNVS